MDTINIIEIVVGSLLLILAFMSVNSNTMIKSIIYLSLLSMLAVVSFVIMRAPDVAITEAVIGSGLITAVFLFTLQSVRKVGDKK